MNPDFTLENASSICVLVVGVGKISAAKFNEYFSLISACDRIPFTDITLHDATSSFKSQDRLNAHVSFNYVTDGSGCYQWDNLHFPRRIHGVIGVIDGKVNVDLYHAYKSFVHIVSQHSGVLDSRCFVIERDLNEGDQGAFKNIIVIPNQGSTHVKFYVNTMINDYAASMLKILESLYQAKAHDQSEHQSILYVPFERSIALDESNKNFRKRASGRMEKLIGDICLVASSPLDAQVHYISAVEHARAFNDWLWLAASLEGWAATLVLLPPPQGLSQAEIVAAVESKYLDAITYYGKAATQLRESSVLQLELESLLILARYLATSTPPGSRYIQVANLVQSVMPLASKIGEKDNISLMCSLALLFESIGYHRKTAFFIRQAALLYMRKGERSGWFVAHRFLLRALHAYGLNDLSDIIVPYGMSDTNKEKEVRARSRMRISRHGECHSGGWPSLQAAVLRELILVSKRLEDPNCTVHYVAYFLNVAYHSLGSSEQEDLSLLFDSLTTKQSNSALCLSLCRMPVVSSLQLAKMPPGCAPKSLDKRESPTKKSCFIYSSFAKADVEVHSTVWVAGEINETLVYISNPMAFEVVVEHMTLLTSGVHFEAYPISFALAPFSPPRSFSLSGKPLESGVLTLLGCTVRAFGVESQHRADIPVDIRIIAAMPLLSIIWMPPPPYVEIAAAAFLEGTETTLVARFTNVSAVVVTTASIEISYFYQDDDSCDYGSVPPLKDTVHWDSDSLSKQLPLLPGNSVEIPFDIVALFGVPGIVIRCTYISDTDRFSRTAECPLAFHVRRVLHIHDVRIIERPKSNTPQTTCLVLFDIRNELRDSFELKVDIDEPDLVASETETYSLASLMDIDTSNGDLVIVPLIGQRQTKHINVRGLSDVRVLIPFRRFALPESMIVTINSERKDLHGRWIDENAVESLIRSYTSALTKLIRIRWGLNIHDMKGSLNLVGQVTLKPEYLSFLQPEMLTIGIKLRIEQNAVAAGSLMEAVECFPLAEIAVDITVTNVSPVSASGLLLELTPYQDLCNGACDDYLRHCLAWVGMLNHRLPKLEPGVNTIHTVIVIPLACGNFSFQVKCMNSQSVSDDGVNDMRNMNFKANESFQLKVVSNDL